MCIRDRYGVRCALSEHWQYGGQGALELAQAVVEACEEPSSLRYLYPLDMPLRDVYKRQRLLRGAWTNHLQRADPRPQRCV